MSHIGTSHVPRRNESCHTQERVMSHIEMSRVSLQHHYLYICLRYELDTDFFFLSGTYHLRHMVPSRVPGVCICWRYEVDTYFLLNVSLNVWSWHVFSKTLLLQISSNLTLVFVFCIFLCTWRFCFKYRHVTSDVHTHTHTHTHPLTHTLMFVYYERIIRLTT